MHFTSLFSLALLATTSLASPLKRDVKPIVDSLSNISGAFVALATKIEAFTGAEADGKAVIMQSHALVNFIQTAKTAIQPIAVLSPVETAGVAAPGNTLVTDINKVIDRLTGHKADFDKLGLSADVRSSIVHIKSEGEQLIKIISSKLPASLAAAGEAVGKQINAALDKGLAVFK
ncbi:hypothetical protein EJ06DRAFT_479935 [Trichodelitschia bisporula]|uniref:Hydrophobic surface binding protein A n=1 Tax=Trichodelitschia bisporula TaxID=703511 RepID=A0A6G1HS78_9PEZI|nr:hypothetical protein EJ06DRAFT_479935 [Trichodelitschia bisporula]